MITGRTGHRGQDASMEPLGALLNRTGVLSDLSAWVICWFSFTNLYYQTIRTETMFFVVVATARAATPSKTMGASLARSRFLEPKKSVAAVAGDQFDGEAMVTSKEVWPMAL